MVVHCVSNRKRKEERGKRKPGAAFLFRLFSLAWLTVSLAPSVLAASTAPYERKSISYLDAVLLTDAGIRISDDELRYLLQSVEKSLSLERFDYNPLPQPLIEEFVKRCRQEQPLSMERITRLMETTIVPKIEQLLQENLEQRAAGLVSEEAKRSWAAEKAKSLGITAVELEKVLNSAYIYFPVLTGIRRSERERRVIVELSGSVIWYRVFLAGVKPDLRLVGGMDDEGPSLSRGFGRTDVNFSYHGDVVSGREYAFLAAVDNFARNMEVAARQLPEFKLAGTVREVGAENISFDIGTKEGIGLDDKFLVTQISEDATGVSEEVVGLVRVSRVGFSGYSERQLNRFKEFGQSATPREPSFSRARPVMGQGFDEGMMAVEYPRLGLDVAIGLHAFPVRFGATDTSETYLINTTKKQTTLGFGFKLAANYNTARWSGISQLYMMLEGGYGVVGVEAKDFLGNAVPVATYQTIGGGLIKKFSFRRVSIPLKAEFGLQAVDLKGWWSLIPDSDNDELIVVRNSAVGVTVGSGFEYVLSPASVLYIALDYRLFSRSKVWDVIVNKDVAIPFWGPWVNGSGVNIGVSIVYSPPKLTFDPLNLVRAAMGI